jgi:hypothetical protein
VCQAEEIIIGLAFLTHPAERHESPGAGRKACQRSHAEPPCRVRAWHCHQPWMRCLGSACSVSVASLQAFHGELAKNSSSDALKRMPCPMQAPQQAWLQAFLWWAA